RKPFRNCNDLVNDMVLVSSVAIRAAVKLYRRLSKELNDSLLTGQFAILNMHLPDIKRNLRTASATLWLILPEAYRAAVARAMEPQVRGIVKSYFRHIIAPWSLDIYSCSMFGSMASIGTLRKPGSLRQSTRISTAYKA
ncbi:hypothetical protein HDU78_006792, partial [Chytriomyces hyalinus]